MLVLQIEQINLYFKNVDSESTKRQTNPNHTPFGKKIVYANSFAANFRTADKLTQS